MSDQENSSLRLSELVLTLPEVYQPVYGHPEFDHLVSRRGDDRLAAIADVVAALRRKLQRQIRVLDLGCAQGWISFNVAKLGASVLGVDHHEPNIDLCNALAMENLRLAVSFHRADIEDLPKRLRVGDFDLVLGLSVFHHLSARFGKEFGRDLIRRYIKNIPNAVLELATSKETPDWAKSLPDTVEYFIEEIPFFTILSYNATHLRSTRPLYFCSRELSFNDRKLEDLSSVPRSTA